VSSIGRIGESLAIVLLVSLIPLKADSQSARLTPQPATCDLIVRSEITIDRPVNDVWPHILDLGSWMSHLHFQTIKGERGNEGEVRRVTLEGTTPYHPYFITTVRVIQFERYVLKITSEDGPAYFGFADFSLAPVGRKVHLTYSLYVELKVPDQSEEQARKSCNEQHESTERDVSANNRNLQILVESEPRHSSSEAQ
jgi:hypothetical protein